MLTDLSSTTKCDQIQASIIINLVTPKAATKRELIFNKPASEAFLTNVYAPSIIGICGIFNMLILQAVTESLIGCQCLSHFKMGPFSQ